MRKGGSKNYFYEYETGKKEKSDSSIIKWYQTNLSYEEKYRFNLLTYPEYLEWQKELAKEAALKNSTENNNDNPIKMGDRIPLNSETFWHEDTEDRTNISAKEYSEFLAENNIDVSNSNTINFSSLYNSVNGGVEEYAFSSDVTNCDSTASSDNDVNEADILAQVNKDIHGGNAILSQDEIEALIASMGVN